MKKTIRASLILFAFTLFAFYALVETTPSFGTKEPEKVRNFSLTYQVDIKDVPAGAKKMNIWVPYPANDEEQTILNVSVDSPYPVSVKYDPEWGNRILFTTIDNPKPFQFKIKYLVKRKERRVMDFDYESPLKIEANAGQFQNFLKPSALAVTNDSVKNYSDMAVRGKKNSLAKARGIYDFVFANMNYDKKIPGYGKGDVNRLCFVIDNGKEGTGNCTDFHSLFMAMMQVQGIPVKFEMGYPLKPNKDQSEPQVGGYHCWAKFFIPTYGWIPVDISEADKSPESKEYFWGSICENRIRFSTGRDIRLNPPQQGERLNFFGPDPYIEVDGKVFKGFVRSIAYS